MKSLPHRASRKKGFTLTEIAIVLGIIGLILGAIWVAASSVYNNQKVGKASTEMLTIAQGVRSLYSTSSVTGIADGTDMTAALCSASVFPSDSIVSCTTPSITNPWNGTTTVASKSINVASTGDGFQVEMTKVSQSGCIALLSSIGGTGRDSGLWFLSAGTTLPSYTVGTPTVFPMTVTTATSLCSGVNNDNFILAVFKLKG